jgi:hypothetical protein
MKLLLMMILLTFCLSLSASASSEPGFRTGQSTTPTVTVCQLAEDPQRYDNQPISIRAQYDSDGIEREGLSDPLCPETGLALEIGHSTKGRDKLQAAMRGGYPGTLDKTVIGTFTGVFHWHPNDHPPRVMAVLKMEHFTVSRKAFPSGVQK